jgi:hypothetical protein
VTQQLPTTVISADLTLVTGGRVSWRWPVAAAAFGLSASVAGLTVGAAANQALHKETCLGGIAGVDSTIGRAARAANLACKR